MLHPYVMLEQSEYSKFIRTKSIEYQKGAPPARESFLVTLQAAPSNTLQYESRYPGCKFLAKWTRTVRVPIFGPILSPLRLPMEASSSLVISMQCGGSWVRIGTAVPGRGGARRLWHGKLIVARGRNLVIPRHGCSGVDSRCLLAYR